MKVFLMTFVAAVITGLIIGQAINTTKTAPMAAEPVFDRVIKTNTFNCGVFPWPPAFIYDEVSKEIGGHAKPFYDAVFKLLDLRVNYVQVSNYGTYIEDMKSGKIDGMCNDGPYTVPLAKQVNYTVPYQYVPIYLFSRETMPTVNKDDLNDAQYRFVAIDADISAGLKNILFPMAGLVSLPGNADPAQLFLEIMTNKADFVLADLPLYTKFDKSNPGQIKRALAEPLMVYPVGISVLKGEHRLLNTLNTGMAMAVHLGLAAKSNRAQDPTGLGLYNVANPY